ncbi:abortive infection family protein [Solimonas sp. K1W22B-7]|uniref:abortive infection family protein n=1 Tax=Solimonas sp. K1W22B-7 TaxID=2303331 RepID=UPI0013C4E354|nr:abortive infection family protein [Solimonas sp. K1W22B-7]
MKSQIRHLVAQALYVVKAHSLPAACERYGLEPGEEGEAFQSKNQYVMRRLQKISDEKVFRIAQEVVKDFPNDALQAAIESLGKNGRLVSDITRHKLAETLNKFSLAGKRDLLELLGKHWPDVRSKASARSFEGTLEDDIWGIVSGGVVGGNRQVLELVGFLSCSQAKLFQFLEDVVYPIRRDASEQESIVEELNRSLRYDGFLLKPTSRVSGHAVYRVEEVSANGERPADELISQALISFDGVGVNEAWRKALGRRAEDPEGAITAAKTLLETVCKHILDELNVTYGEADDLPKLYASAATQLKLSPDQHSEKVFKTILGNCQSVVGNLAGLRNKLGDSHGQGKRYVRPQSRHAELAVNLAGSMAMFLVSTFEARTA